MRLSLLAWFSIHIGQANSSASVRFGARRCEEAIRILDTRGAVLQESSLILILFNKALSEFVFITGLWVWIEGCLDCIKYIENGINPGAVTYMLASHIFFNNALDGSCDWSNVLPVVIGKMPNCTGNILSGLSNLILINLDVDGVPSISRADQRKDGRG